jgi:hypothetical protein
VAALIVGSCTNDPGIEQAGGGGTNGGKAPKPPGGGGTTGNGGAGAPNPVGGGGANGGGGLPGGSPDTKSCTAVAAMAMPLPVDIYVLLDRSGSMLNDINDPGTGGTFPPAPGVPVKWDATVAALNMFVASPAAQGIQIGLGLFPVVMGDLCGAGSYAMPVVPIDALPASAGAFMAGVASGAPVMNGGTPTFPALQGTIMYAQQREAMMGRRVAIALATDGMPNTCPRNGALQQVMATAQMGANLGIYTFVIGVGKQLANLNQIAVAGGTKMAYLVENATAEQLAAAFKEVQTQAAQLVCSFAIPPPPAGMTLDPDKVNVRFTAPDPTMSFDIGQVTDRNACGPAGGWYYDNPRMPKNVNLCEASCMKARSSGAGSIQVLFGCAGIVIK